METLRDRRKACAGMSRCRYWLKLLGTPELLGKLKRAGEAGAARIYPSVSSMMPRCLVNSVS